MMDELATIQYCYEPSLLLCLKAKPPVDSLDRFICNCPSDLGLGLGAFIHWSQEIKYIYIWGANQQHNQRV